MGSSARRAACAVSLTTLWCCATLWAGPPNATTGIADGPARPINPNIVLILFDDVGVDLLGAYGATDDPPCTPSVDSLAQSGLLFRRAWSNPVCSPTRAQILTGLHGFRSGIGDVVNEGETGGGLLLPALTLPRALPTYATSAIGKWHLARAPDFPTHPLDAGYDWFAGSVRNLGWEVEGGGYTKWVKYVNGASHIERTYATSDTVDDAVMRAALMTPPWFLYVAFNAIHTPHEDPPPGLCDAIPCYRFSCPIGKDRATTARSMLEALDVELGEMLWRLRVIDPNVIVFLVGDNGTSSRVIRPPQDPERVKGTLYEGGIHVPLIVAGGGVRHGESDALVSTVDLLATISELAGTPRTTADSVSFAPLLWDGHAPAPRPNVYAERFTPNFDSADGEKLRRHERAIRDDRYKLIRNTSLWGSSEELYDMQLDPGETTNLLPPGDEDAARAYSDLFHDLRRMGVACEADADDNGRVDLTDLTIVITNLGLTGATPRDGDADRDGDVDATDLAIVLATLDRPC